MNNTVKVCIDGRMVEVAAGSTILEVARRERIPIPTLCHSPLLRPLENCRLCVVSIAGEKQYKAACSTPVAEGMEITTQSEDLGRTRKLLLELLLDTHYGDCVAPCSVACPASVDIQGYLALIRRGEYAEAVRLIKEKLPMPASIGRVCPHPCETACRRHLVDEPINTNHCKRFAADYEIKSGERVLPRVGLPSGHRVAVIGGGPAGLSGAFYLRTLGHGATIYEAREKLGGMLRYGIPEYRLPKKVLDWEIEGILSLGIGVKTQVRWGRDFTLDDLKRDGYDAILFAIGAWASNKLGVVGEELEGTLSAIEFLEQVACGRPPKLGGHVVVIGGGNSAIDAARTAVRLGVKKVTILYRRSRKEMPANPEEISAAEHEGVNLQFLAAPTRLVGENGVLKRLEYIRMELGEPDASNRRRPVPIQGSETLLEVDQVINAIGQFPALVSPESDSAMARIPVTRWNTFGGDPKSMHTGREIFFAAGDAYRGPMTVVMALADGRKAAYSMDAYFRTSEIRPEPVEFNISKGTLQTIDPEPFSAMKSLPREAMPELAVEAAVRSFEPVELGFSEEQARNEASRCLACGCSAAFDCRLRTLMNEFQVDWREQPSKKIHFQRVAAVDSRATIAFDPNKCVRCERCYEACKSFQASGAIELRDTPRLKDNCVDCGLCVDLCPTGALMEKREGRPVERLDWKKTKTHCIHCAVGCELELKLKGERLVWIGDGSYSPPNWGSTCRRGRFRTFDPLWYGERLLEPMVRENGTLREVSWHKAIAWLLDGFRTASERHGAGALGALGSARASNESLYLLQKWMRTGWMSHGIDFPGRKTRETLWTALQSGERVKRLAPDLEKLERGEAIVVCGDGIEKAAPVVATMIRRAARNRRVPVLQLSSCPDELTPFASAAVHAPVSAWGEVLRAIEPGSPSGLGTIDLSGRGLSAAQAEGFKAALEKAASVALVFPEALLESDGGSGAVQAVFRLAGSLGELRSADRVGLIAIPGEINASGALLMGALPHRLPGGVPLSDQPGVTHLCEVWQIAELPKGGDWPALEEALEGNRIRALFVQQPRALFEADPVRWQDLLSRVEFLVVQDCLPSPATEAAQVVLPLSAFGEQAGSLINLEGRLLELSAAFHPQGKALSDWETLAQIMATQGLAFPKDIGAVREEIQRLVPEFATIRGAGAQAASSAPLPALNR